MDKLISDLFTKDKHKRRKKASGISWDAVLADVGAVASTAEKDAKLVFNKTSQVGEKIIDKGFAFGTDVVDQTEKAIESLGKDAQKIASDVALPLAIGGVAVVTIAAIFLFKK